MLSHIPADGWYPCVGMHSEGEEVKLNLDAQWEHSDVILMSIDNHEEEWARLHDVRINGQVGRVEFVFIGGNSYKSLITIRGAEWL